MNAIPVAHAADSVAVLVIFVLTYAGIAIGHVPGLKLDRTGIALLGAIAVMAFSGLSTATVVGFINGPTVLLLFGFFVLSAQLRLSGLFDRIATTISARADNPGRFLLTLMLVTAGLSAVMNHDIVCFVFAPVVGSALLQRRINPVPFLIAIAIASNIGAAATVVGNPQNMMIAQVAHLDFARYALWSIAPVVFALGCAYALIRVLSRNEFAFSGPAPVDTARPVVPFDRPHAIKGLVILGLVIAFFFTSVPRELVALTAAGIHLASPKFKTSELLGLVDWPILVLFMALFVVTGALEATGFGGETAHWLTPGTPALRSPYVLAVVTAVLSNLINNSAAALLLVKMVNVANPVTAYVLALSNSFGGSLIIVGSVSNIIVVQQARELGVDISFRDFARIGVPVTLAAMAGLLIWVALVT